MFFEYGVGALPRSDAGFDVGHSLLKVSDFGFGFSYFLLQSLDGLLPLSLQCI